MGGLERSISGEAPSFSLMQVKWIGASVAPPAAPAVPAPTARAAAIDARLLLVSERGVKGVEGRPYGLDGQQHRVETLLHNLEPGRSAGRELARASRRNRFRGLGGSRPQLVERRALGFIRADQTLDAFHAPFGEASSARVAHGGDATHATPAHHAGPHHHAGTPAVATRTARPAVDRRIGRIWSGLLSDDGRSQNQSGNGDRDGNKGKRFHDGASGTLMKFKKIRIRRRPGAVIDAGQRDLEMMAA